MNGHLMNEETTTELAEVIIDSSDQFICDEDFDYSVFWKSDRNYDLPVFGENPEETETSVCFSLGPVSEIQESWEHDDHCYAKRPMDTWSYSLRPGFERELDELMQMISDHETACSKKISPTVSNHSSTHTISVKENAAPVEKISPTAKQRIPNIIQVKTRILPAVTPKNDSEVNFIPSRTQSRMKPAAWAKTSNKVQSPEEVESPNELLIEKPTDFQNIIIPEFEPRVRKIRVSKFKSNLDIIKEHAENIDDNQKICGEVSQIIEKKVDKQKSHSLDSLDVERNERYTKSGDHGSDETHLLTSIDPLPILQRTEKKLEAQVPTISSVLNPEIETFKREQVNTSTVPAVKINKEGDTGFIPSRSYSRMKPSAGVKKSKISQASESIDSSIKPLIQKPSHIQDEVIPGSNPRARKSRVSNFTSNLDNKRENVVNIDDNQEITRDVPQKTEKKVESKNSYSLPILEVEETKRYNKSGDHGSNETHLPILHNPSPKIIQRPENKLEAQLSTTSVSKPENETFKRKQVNSSTVPSRTYSMITPSAGVKQNSYSLNILEAGEHKGYIKSGDHGGDKTHLPISINRLPNIEKKLETQVSTMSSDSKPKKETFRAKQVNTSTVPAVKTNKGGEVDFIPSRIYSRMKPCAGVRKPKIVQTSATVDSFIEPLIQQATNIQNEVLPEFEPRVKNSRVSRHDISGELSRETRKEEKTQNSHPLGLSKDRPVKVQSEKGSNVPNFAKSKSHFVTNPLIIKESRDSNGNNNSSEKQNGNNRKNERYFEQAKCPRTNLSQENPKGEAQYVFQAPSLSKEIYSSKKTDSDYKRKETLFEKGRKSLQANLTEGTKDNSKRPLASSSCLSKLETRMERPCKKQKENPEVNGIYFDKTSNSQATECKPKNSIMTSLSGLEMKGTLSDEKRKKDHKSNKRHLKEMKGTNEGVSEDGKKLASKEREKKSFPGSSKESKERSGKLSNPDSVPQKHTKGSVNSDEDKNTDGKRKEICSEKIKSGREGISHEIPKKKEFFGKIQKYEKHNSSKTTLSHKNNEGFEKNISNGPSGSGLKELRRSDHYGGGHKKDGKEKVNPFRSKSPQAQKKSVNYSKLSDKNKEKCVSSERKTMRSAEEHKEDRIIEKTQPSRSECPQAQKETLSYSILKDMDIEKFMPKGMNNNMNSSGRKRKHSAEDRVCIGSEINKKNALLLKIYYKRPSRRETVLPESDRESDSSEIGEEGRKNVPPPKKRQKTNDDTKRSNRREFADSGTSRETALMETNREAAYSGTNRETALPEKRRETNI